MTTPLPDPDRPVSLLAVADEVVADIAFQAGYKRGKRDLLSLVLSTDLCQTCLKRIHLSLLQHTQSVRAYARTQGVELPPERPEDTASRHELARELGVEP